MNAVVDRIGRSPAPMSAASDAKRKRIDLAHEIRQGLGLLLVMFLTAAAIVAMRALAFLLGHDEIPLFRELGRLWN